MVRADAPSELWKGLVWLGLDGPLELGAEIRDDGRPVFMGLMPKVNPLLTWHLPKRFRPVVWPVIYEVVPSVEVLVVREDQPLVGGCAKVPLHPLQLV